MEDNEEVEREGSDVENEAGEEAGDKVQQEYVKKEFFAKPYVSPYNTENEVRALTTKNNR